MGTVPGNWYIPQDRIYIALSCVSGVYYLFSESNINDPLNHDVATIMKDNLNQFRDNVKEL